MSAPNRGTAPGAFSVQLYAATPHGPVNWRLLSANNRECGRGDGGFPDAQRCAAFVAALQSRLPRARRRCRRDERGRWSWELELDGRTIATSGRSFDRLIRCEQGAAVFLAEFAAAPLRPSMTVSGARRFGSVA